ncbi:MAG: TRAP transporter large permease, partial [Burkholderiaceae bacterium]
VSITRLFIAGVVPGLLLAGLFMGYTIVWALRNPGQVPPADISLTFWEKVVESRHLLPVVGLIAVVLGSIYAGIATATEAAALGVVGALILSAAQRTLTWTTFWDALMAATRLYCMIALILAGSAFLALSMGFIGLPRQLAETISAMNLSPFALIMLLMVFFVVLGCFLDGISMVVLTMAVLLPTLQTAGIDLLWFGVFIVVVVEMAQVTPPVGFNLFVLQGMTKRQINTIAVAAFPYFLMMVVAVFAIWFFPALVTYLPGQMKL